MTGIHVVAMGSALPPKIVTNAALAEELDTSDQWIVDRTGIRERRVGGSTTILSTTAALAAIDVAAIDPATIGLLILATSTADQTLPAGAASVARELGLRCGLFEVDASCAGFVYALIAGAMMTTGAVQRALVIGADAMSRLTDPTDRSTAVLFGDGAGAVILEATDRLSDLLSWDFGSDPSAGHLLRSEHGGVIIMEGQEVFRRALRSAVNSATTALERAAVAPTDIALFVPHQANARLLEALADRIGIPRERTAIDLENTGNTSAASIPLALHSASRAGRLRRDDLVLLCGFGAA